MHPRGNLEHYQILLKSVFPQPNSMELCLLEFALSLNIIHWGTSKHEAVGDTLKSHPNHANLTSKHTNIISHNYNNPIKKKLLSSNNNLQMRPSKKLWKITCLLHQKLTIGKVQNPYLIPDYQVTNVPKRYIVILS